MTFIAKVLYYLIMLKKINDLEKHHQLLASMIVGVGIVSLWRGMWGLLDLYLIPENPLVSYLLSSLVGVTILYITHKKFS